jgi:hypothetical protein
MFLLYKLSKILARAIAKISGNQFYFGQSEIFIFLSSSQDTRLTLPISPNRSGIRDWNVPTSPDV